MISAIILFVTRKTEENSIVYQCMSSSICLRISQGVYMKFYILYWGVPPQHQLQIDEPFFVRSTRLMDPL